MQIIKRPSEKSGAILLSVFEESGLFPVENAKAIVNYGKKTNSSLFFKSNKNGQIYFKNLNTHNTNPSLLKIKIIAKGYLPCRLQIIVFEGTTVVYKLNLRSSLKSKKRDFVRKSFKIT